MATLLQNIRQARLGRGSRESGADREAASRQRSEAAPTVDIAPNDPLLAYFLASPGAAEIDKLTLDSPALHALWAAGVRMVVPLVSQGELIGLLNLGPRLSGQDYSSDDRGLLNNLATQAAPAVRVAQLVQQQQAETRARERMEHELRVARLIQQTLLPKEIPAIEGWQLAAYYQPARAVGGDFYDFIPFDDGRMALVIGDVTDKGVPAALVMATTRAILRSAVQPTATPGQVLQRANDLLCPDIPPKMFVTCLYAVLDPKTGRLQYANAGHDLPYLSGEGQVTELQYEEKETRLKPGESVLFYSDGLVEAHNARREMFSFPHLKELLAERPAEGTTIIERLLSELENFTGAGWEQEDDVTLVTLERAENKARRFTGASLDEWQTLGEWEVPSAPGNERIAIQEVAEAVAGIGLHEKSLQKLKTAVAEALMNAMEHGNHYQADKPVAVRIRANAGAVSVSITDEGGDQQIKEPGTPDLEAKLAGLQTPRGWGLFLIKNLVDDMRVSSDGAYHTVELIIYRGGNQDADQST
ncbi:MAG: ATP-binding SpoIIE family protein phosphatase [Chloroflexia bacterium]